MNRSHITAITVLALVVLILTGPNVFAGNHKHKNQKNSPNIECEINSKIDHHSNNNAIGNRQDCINNSPNLIDSTINGPSDNNNRDFTSPTVVSTDPSDNDNNVDPSTKTITVTFSEKIDKNTVDTGSLTLDPNVGTSPSIQDVSVSGKTATFTISGLLPHVDYLATISSSIEDSNGNFLDCPGSSGVDSLCQWNFSTSGSSTSASITINPTKGIVGTLLTVSGTGFQPLTDVTVKFDSATGTDQTDATGAFTFSFLVPPATSGDHTVSATQTTTNQGTKSDSKTFTVIPDIVLIPTVGQPGDLVNIKGTGFGSTANVSLKFDSNPLVAAPPAITNNTGGFSTQFTVPQSSNGTHTITASQGSNSASKDFTVTNSTVNIASSIDTPLITEKTNLDVPSNIFG
jgi:Big-like domain-containing protein